MIFITVGTANKGFDRLIEECDKIADKHAIDIFAQTGSSKYKPLHLKYSEWLSQDEMKEKYHSASAFIVHGGFGTLSEVLALKKTIIVIPRTFEDGEAVNDQKDISQKLDSLGYVKCVVDLSDLERIITNIDSIKLKEYTLESDIPQILAQQIDIIRNKLL